MRRTNWKTVSTLVTMVVLAGCQEQVTSPVAQKVANAPVAASFAPEGRPSLSLTVSSTSNTSADFTVGPNGGVFFVGNNAVFFPARSICDPATSGYGVGTWDNPCTPATSGIAIHAEVRTLNGRSWVDFSPALRFVPSNDASKWVWMIMYAPGAANAADLTKYNIFYAPTIGGALVDETVADPTLRTYVDRSGLSMRRIKHFSGYTSSAITCDPDHEVCDGGDNGGMQ